jgi:hypothetical protein
VDIIDTLMRIFVANIRFKEFDPRQADGDSIVTRKRPTSPPYDPRN